MNITTNMRLSMSMSTKGKVVRLPRRMRRNLLYHILETSAPSKQRQRQRRSKEEASSAVVAKVAMEDKEGSVISSSSSTALPAVEQIIEEAHRYKATLGTGFSLHTPMVSLALARLGATDTDIESHHTYAMGKNSRYALLPIEEGGKGEPSTSTGTGAIVVVTDENWLSLCNLGGLHEVSFRRYWRGEIARAGRAASVSKLLSHFTDAVHSRLHHGVIRLAYAVEMETKQVEKKDEEIAVALAAFCANHTRLKWTQKEEETKRDISALNMSDGFQQMQRVVREEGVPLSQKMGFAKKYGTFMNDPLYLSSVPTLQPRGLLGSEEGLAEFVRLVVELYLSRPNILSLHMVTGLHALIILRPYYTEEDFEKALLTHWTSTGVLYLSMKAPPLVPSNHNKKEKQEGRMASWDALVAHAIGSRSDHDIKFVDTCLFLHGAFPRHADLIQRAASTLVKGKKK
jgi:hypothetical protein